jgi:hypothetical protein
MADNTNGGRCSIVADPGRRLASVFTAVRAIALLVLTASCRGAAAPPQSAPAPTAAASGALPAAFSRHHVFLRATVGGVPAFLLFDSGASTTILSPRLVQRLGLRYRGRHVAYGVGEPVTNASAYDGTDIRMGAVLIRPATVLSWPGASFPTYAGTTPDGVIGYDLLRSYVVVVDPELGRVTASDTTGPPPPSRRGARTVALRVTNGLPVVDAEIFTSEPVPPRTTVSASLPLVIDFGAGAGLQLSRPAAERLGFPGRLRDARVRQLVGIGGTLDLAEGAADSVRIAGAAVPNALIAIDTTQTPSIALAEAEGFIGTELLRRFIVTLDYARGRAVFEPNALLRFPFCRNAAGLCVRAETGQRSAEVAFVDPGSSAARAGIQPGYAILSIDGVSLAQLSSADIDRLLDRGPGPMLEIVRNTALLRTMDRSEGTLPVRIGRSRRVVPRERAGELIRLPAP